jgi:hypothetical protein
MTFDHTNLSEVKVEERGFSDIPAGTYSLEVIKAALVDYVTGPTSKTPGVPGQRIDFQFAIVGDPNYAGRRIFQPGLFPSDKTNQQLRLVMDATGIPQKGTIEAWLQQLVAGKARFSSPVESFQDLDKRTDPPTPRTKQRANLYQAQPSLV